MRARSAVLLFTVLAFAAGAGARDPARPDLTGMAPAVREAIEQLQEKVAALAETGEASPAELGVAYYALGEVYHAHGLSESARAIYSESLRLNPENERAAYLLGCLRQQAGELKEAAALFEKVLSRQPGDPALLIRLGDVRLELGQPETARGYFERALAADGSSAAAHYGLGRVAAALGEAESAVEHFEEALDLQPEASAVHYPLALAYRRLGNLEKARSHLERRGQEEVTFPDPGRDRLSRIAATSALQVVLDLAADRDAFSPRDFLGFTLGQLGETVGSVEYLREVIEMKKAGAPSGGIGGGNTAPEGGIGGGNTAPEPGQETELARIRYAIAGLLVFQGKDKEAITELRDALDLAPDFAEAHVMLANALARAGEFTAAAKSYDRAIELDPDNGEAWLKRATVRFRLGQEEQAADELRQLTARAPEMGEGWLRLAAILERLGRVDEAVETFEKAVVKNLSDPEKAVAHRSLAGLLRLRGDLTAALGHYESALDFDAESVETRLELAGTLGFLDRFEEAADQYASVVASVPENEEARLGEISALILSERFRDARARLEEGHRVMPESVALAHLLARFLTAAPDEALRDGQRALEISQALFEQRRSLAVGETVAMALAQTGNSERAVELQRSLLAAAERAGAAELVAQRLGANLARYQEGLRCCADSGPAILLPPPEAAEAGDSGS